MTASAIRSFDEMCRAKSRGLAWIPAIKLHASYLRKKRGDKAVVPIEDYDRVIKLLEDALNAIPVTR